MKREYQDGAVVFARKNPTQKLIVRRWEGETYYCKLLTDLRTDEIAFVAADLVSLKFQNLDLA